MNPQHHIQVYNLLLRTVVACIIVGSGLFYSLSSSANTKYYQVHKKNLLQGSPMSWKNALQLMHENLPKLLLARKRLQGNKRSTRYAGAFPNPSIAYRREQLFPQQGQDEVGIQLTIPLGGSTWRQKDVASAKVQVQSWSVKLLHLRHKFRFLRDYFNLLHQVMKLRILVRSYHQFQQLQGVVKVRVQEGKLPGVYLLRLGLEMQQRQSQIDRLRAIIERKGRQLGFQVGQKHQPIIPTGPLVPGFSQLPVVTRDLLTQLPPLQHAKAQSKLAKEQQRLAFAKAWPNLQLDLGYLHANNTSQSQPDGHGFYLGISVPLPIFQRNQYNTKRTTQTLHVARYKVRLLLRQYRNQIMLRKRQLKGSRTRWQSYKRNVSGRIKNLLRSAQAAFIGGTSVQAYLDMQLTAERLQLFELSLQNDIRMSSLQLHKLMGRIPHQ